MTVMAALGRIFGLPIALGLSLVARDGRVESSLAQTSQTAGAGLRAQAHLDFRITIVPSIKLPPQALLGRASAYGSPAGGTVVTQLRFSRNGVTSQLLVADGSVIPGLATRYTVLEP